jgi:hypothetical protein
MKFAILLLPLFFSIHSHAGEYPEFRKAYSTESTGGCSLKMPFVSTHDDEPKKISWTGACLNGKASGYGTISTSNGITSYFAKFSDGELASPYYADVQDGLMPFYKKYEAKGFGKKGYTQDLNCNATKGAECLMLENAMKAKPSAIAIQGAPNCIIYDAATTNNFMNSVSWTGNCVGGFAEGAGWLNYSNMTDMVQTYIEVSKGKMISSYFVRIVHSALPEIYVGKTNYGYGIQKWVQCQKNEKDCLRMLEVMKSIPEAAWKR